MTGRPASAAAPVVVTRDDPPGRAAGALVAATTRGAWPVLRLPPSADALATVRRVGPNVLLAELVPPGAGGATAPAVPGVAVLRSPVTVASVRTELGRARPLTDAELTGAVRLFCRSAQRIRRLLHDLGNALAAPAAGVEPVRRGLERLARVLDAFAWAEAARTVRAVPGFPPGPGWHEAVRAALRGVAACAFGGPSADEAEPAPPAHPPAGFETILAADDHGYPAEWLGALGRHGYGVEVVTDAGDARTALAVNPAGVFACDLGWNGDPLAGRRLLALARKQPLCRLVVAVTAAAIGRDEVPEADAVCAGPDSKTAAGAEALHRIIWRRAGGETG